MSWVRLDDLFPEHPKVIGLSDAAFRLHVRAICYSSRMLTDGRVPETWLTGGRGKVPKAAEQLVAAGLWDRDQSGFQIHDYLEYQKSREDIVSGRSAKSDKRVAAGRLGGLAKASNRLAKSSNASLAKPSNATGLLDTVPSKTVAPFPSPLEGSQNDPSVHGASKPHPIKDFLACYERLFVAQYGDKPAIHGGKDARLAKHVIDRHGVDKARALLEQFFRSSDPFIARSGHTIGVFSSQQNKLIAELATRNGRQADAGVERAQQHIAKVDSWQR